MAASARREHFAGGVRWAMTGANNRNSRRRPIPEQEKVMTGRKTHEQQVRVIEERENTKNAGKDFDAEAELKKSKQEREAYRKGSDLRTDAPNLVDPDDRNMLRGENQESEHHKRRADD
jgi:hypothetical protein